MVRKVNVKENGYLVSLHFLLCGLFFAFTSLSALDPQKSITQYKLDTWQSERGLIQKVVFSILQTRDGYIWLGTLDGLVQFDGFRFITYNKENKKELQDNCIRVLLEDRNGILWIGTETGGLSYLKDGIFETYSQVDCPELKKICALFEDREGTLWIGTLNNGLTCFKDGNFFTYTSEDGLASNRIRAFYEDKEGMLWIATSGGLSICDPSGGFSAFSGKSGRFDEHIYSMCHTKKGELWLGCRFGLYRLKNSQLTYFGTADGLPNPKIMCLYEDSDQNLWAGTDGGGLIRVRNDRIEPFPIGEKPATDYIYAVHEDKEKNLWLGSVDKGLHRLRDTTIIPYTTREGLSHDNVQCIAEGGEGNLWIGTMEGVNLLYNDRVALKWTTKDGLSSNRVTAIIKDSNGSIWIGTEKGLNRYKDGRLNTFNFQNGGRFNYILQLREDREGAIWILTKENLKRFYKGNFTEILNKKELSDHLLMCFYIDGEGNPWIGTNNGGIFRLKDGDLKQYTINEKLVHNEVECFYEGEGGVLYIGTRGGLSLLKKEEFTNYTTADGLLDSFIYQIVEDEVGDLWLVGRTGVSCISKRELSEFAIENIEKIRPRLFNEADGFKSPYCIHATKTRDGRLWFATDQGVAMIDPSNIKKNTVSPPVVLEEMIVDGEDINIKGIQSHFKGKTPFIIHPGTKRLEFYYTGLSFIKSQEIKFKIKLEGYDSDWIDKGNERSTTYTSLQPGKYTFRVKACNSDGVWNEKGASFSFYLKPFFTQTYWFYLLIAVAVLLSAFSFYRFRIRQLKTRQNELGTLVKLRTKEVEEKNRQLESQTVQLKEQSEKLQEMDKVKSRFFANISHEFRTPLTLLLGPLEQMIEACGDNEKEKKRKLTLMLRNSQRLLRLINQLLELSKLDSGKMKLQTQRTNIVSFIKGICASFQLLAQQKELELVFQADENAKEIALYIDPRKMEDVMSNLLINALKFTPAGGVVRVSVTDSKDSAEISVSDTGPGIPAEELANIFDRFYQADTTYEYHQKGSGIGLALAKELVELHGGSIEAKSHEGQGSTFTIRLGNAHTDEQETTVPIEGAPMKEIRMEMAETELDMEPETDFNLDSEMGTAEKNIILVVEDSADMREYIKGALEPEYWVVEAADGKEGIEKAQQIIPDLIISDIMMPEKDGYELCRTLKSDVQTSHIPIILLTAKASEENILEGLETGADDYVTKPFSTKILSARIKNLIDIRNQLQQNIKREMNLQPVKTSVSKLDQEFLQDLQTIIKKNLSDPEFNVEELCKKLYMSNTTLYRKIQALCGQTPTDFIRSCRLKRAAQLLKDNFGSVTEVAFEVGFSSRTYFTKCFKEKFHQLPSEVSQDSVTKVS